jgi:hypothetical protein
METWITSTGLAVASLEPNHELERLIEPGMTCVALGTTSEDAEGVDQPPITESDTTPSESPTAVVKTRRRRRASSPQGNNSSHANSDEAVASSVPISDHTSKGHREDKPILLPCLVDPKSDEEAAPDQVGGEPVPV